MVNRVQVICFSQKKSKQKKSQNSSTNTTRSHKMLIHLPTAQHIAFSYKLFFFFLKRNLFYVRTSNFTTIRWLLIKSSSDSVTPMHACPYVSIYTHTNICAFEHHCCVGSTTYDFVTRMQNVKYRSWQVQGCSRSLPKCKTAVALKVQEQDDIGIYLIKVSITDSVGGVSFKEYVSLQWKQPTAVVSPLGIKKNWSF